MRAHIGSRQQPVRGRQVSHHRMESHPAQVADRERMTLTVVEGCQHPNNDPFRSQHLVQSSEILHLNNRVERAGAMPSWLVDHEEVDA